MNGLDPWAHLKDVLSCLPGHLNSRIDELLGFVALTVNQTAGLC